MCVEGKPVELELKPLEVLVSNCCSTRGRSDQTKLLDAVWPGLMVVDSSLATAVSKLRKALGDEDSSIVLTVPRVGYRMGVPMHGQPITTSSDWGELGFNAGDAIPGREHWGLVRPLDVSRSSEVWLAAQPKTHELRVFKFASNVVRLKSLKREVTVSRFFRESLGDRSEFVHILEWNFEVQPYSLKVNTGD